MNMLPMYVYEPIHTEFEVVGCLIKTPKIHLSTLPRARPVLSLPFGTAVQLGKLETLEQFDVVIGTG